jgi:hypothetical protein
MGFFNGLYSYEIALLVLGVALFFVTLGAFWALMIRGKPFSKLVPLFIISVAMMGYPGIQSISFQNGVVTITKVTSQLQQDPTNTALRQTLQKAVDETASRPAADPNTMATIATAQFALGNKDAAEAQLSAASRTAPQLPAVVALQQKIDLDNKLTTLTSQVQENPTNEGAKAQLQQAVTEGSALKIANPLLLTDLASAQLAVGNSNQASVLADRALKIQPNLPAATALKQRISQNK